MKKTKLTKRLGFPNIRDEKKLTQRFNYPKLGRVQTNFKGVFEGEIY